MGEVGAVKRTKVHSLIDKVYSKTNLQMAWEKVKANRGAGGIDKVSIAAFDEVKEEELDRLQKELKQQHPMPVRRVHVPKRDNPAEKRPLGIPAIQDRVCQQALKNRIEPIFESEFDHCSFGYRPGHSPHGAMRKIWTELMPGYYWILDADLKDYFGSVNHDKLIDMVAERISDGRVLKLIRQMLQAGCVEEGKHLPIPLGSPQGGLC
jgi:RNA-directed DNA polymerase